MPKISIIIPAYNVENSVGNTIENILQQNFDDFEILIINDGSIDNTLSILNEYEKEDSRIKVINKKNGGAATARNVGIQAAAGEYIMFIDSDDNIMPGMFSKMYSQVIEHNLDVCVCDYYYDSGNDNMYCSAKPNLSLDDKKELMLSFVAPWGKLIRKSLITDNDLYFFENHYYEDLAVIPAYGLYASKIIFLNEAFYVYNQRDNSLMNQTKYNPKFNDTIESLNYLCEFYKKENLYDKYYSEIEFIYICYLLHDSSLRLLPFKEGRETLNKIVNIMTDNFPKWKQNKYYKKQSLKYKIVCSFIINKKFKMLKKILNI